MVRGSEGYSHCCCCCCFSFSSLHPPPPLPHLSPPPPSSSSSSNADDYLRDLEEMVEQAHSLINQLRKILPHVNCELALSSCRRTFRRGSELVALLDTLETQIHNLGGLVITANDVFPNATHGEFVRAMRNDLIDLVALCQAVSVEVM